jgi:hypothetical protein
MYCKRHKEGPLSGTAFAPCVFSCVYSDIYVRRRCVTERLETNDISRPQYTLHRQSGAAYPGAWFCRVPVSGSPWLYWSRGEDVHINNHGRSDVIAAHSFRRKGWTHTVTVLTCLQHPDHQPNSGTNPANSAAIRTDPSPPPAINPGNRPTAHLPGLLGLHITITQVSRSTPPFRIRSSYYYGIPSFSPDYS